ncbi:MAG: hypothetical protein GEU83_19395 [Pseudonocardiaceae bacterium]|nr:hypothetical protein [Pseudonocardiaceae bacterium]
MSGVPGQLDLDGMSRARDGAAPAPPGLAIRLLRGLSGALAAGLVVLAVLLGIAQWLSGPDTVPGPGIGALVGHYVGAAVVVVLQWVADRRRGAGAVGAALAVIAIVGTVLWIWWWL